MRLSNSWLEDSRPGQVSLGGQFFRVAHHLPYHLFGMGTLTRIRKHIRENQKVSGSFLVMAVAILPIVAACSDDTAPVVERTPPFPPDGVFSVTGDGVVTIYWNQNWEEDLAVYAVYRSREFDDPNEPYEWQADVPWDQIDAQTGLVYFDDTNVNNGDTWYYAVTAIDVNENESDLSYEFVVDTPRPEGYDLILNNYLGQNSSSSGYDFDAYSVQADDLVSTDIYFGTSNGDRYIFTTAGVDIQDYGTISLIDVDVAPSSGWAPSGRAEAIIGHSYVLRINNGLGGFNVAKIYVADVSDESVTLDWAYQEVMNSPELAPGGGAMQ